MKAYQARPIRFLDLMHHKNWTIKVYSISHKNLVVPNTYRAQALTQLDEWLALAQNNNMQTYNIATLIFHECKEGCFAIINWWIDDNMLQHFVFLSTSDKSRYELYSSSGIITCVWELSVLWFERNAWVQHVLTNKTPNFEAYLQEQLNQD
jgi:hypothetical protein